MSDIYLSNIIESFGIPPLRSGGVRLQPMQIHEINGLLTSICVSARL